MRQTLPRERRACKRHGETDFRVSARGAFCLECAREYSRRSRATAAERDRANDAAFTSSASDGGEAVEVDAAKANAKAVAALAERRRRQERAVRRRQATLERKRAARERAAAEKEARARRRSLGKLYAGVCRRHGGRETWHYASGRCLWCSQLARLRPLTADDQLTIADHQRWLCAVCGRALADRDLSNPPDDLRRKKSRTTTTWFVDADDDVPRAAHAHCFVARCNLSLAALRELAAKTVRCDPDSDPAPPTVHGRERYARVDAKRYRVERCERHRAPTVHRIGGDGECLLCLALFSMCDAVGEENLPLAPEHQLEICDAQGHACALCGGRFRLLGENVRCEPYGVAWDRVRADGSYSRENVRAVHRLCARTRRGLAVAEYRAWCADVAQ